MQLKFKNTFWGYFDFYYSVIGNKLILYLGLGIIVSFLDGIGLSMFMPLLQSAGTKATTGAAGATATKHSMGQLHYVTDLVVNMGFPLTINVVLAMLVIMFCLKGILKFVQMYYQATLRYLFIQKIRYSLVNNLQDLSYRGFLKLDAGKIQNTLTAEVQRLFQTLNFYFNAAQAAVTLVTYIGLAFLANYQFAILVALGSVLSNFIYRKIYIATKKASIEVSRKGNDFNGFLIEAIHYFKYLKSTNYFSRFSKRLKKVIDSTEVLNRKMGVYTAITTSVKEPMIIIIVVAVIYLQINMMGASLTSIVLSLLLFYRALSYLIMVQNHWQNFIQNIGAMNSVSILHNEMSVSQEENKPTEFPTLGTELLIDNVVFSYGASNVLNGINISIPKNKTIALIGESGSGKSTIANLIAGLIAPDSGVINIDGVDLHSYNIRSYRSKIGYISQEPVIFSDDIYNNITFWAERTEENVKRFWDTVELASLTDFINKQPDKEKTTLGDNGILISGGQKQRISIARELYKDVEILILDEATSALDSETERVIQDNIEKLHGSYTMVIIAHRLSTIKDADAIYLLEQGQVLSSGTFNSMLESSDRFRRMVSLQEV